MNYQHNLAWTSWSKFYVSAWGEKTEQRQVLNWTHSEAHQRKRDMLLAGEAEGKGRGRNCVRERKIKLCLGGRDRGQSTRRRGQGTGGWAAEGEGGPSRPRAPECWNIPGCAWVDARLHARMVCSRGVRDGDTVTPWQHDSGAEWK